MKKDMWEYWKTATGVMCIVVPFMIVIFGGEFSIKINLHSIVELREAIKRYTL